MEHSLALDLASTIRHDGDGGVADDLATVQGAARWLRGRAGLPAEYAQADDPHVDERLREEIVAVRRATRALFARAAPQLDWPPGGPPAARLLSAEADPRVRLVAALARAAVEFLCGPQLGQLRACTAPRCVRYFLKTHGRQEWCKPSCGNRARAARHYRRHHTP